VEHSPIVKMKVAGIFINVLFENCILILIDFE